MPVEVTYDMVVPEGKILSEADWNVIAGIIGIEIESGIDNQVDVTGHAYAPLKPETIKRKMGAVKMQKEGTESTFANPEPTKRLIATGNLRRNRVVEKLPDGIQLTIGPTREAIAVYQQGGTDHIPATPFFGLSLKCQERIVDFYDSRLTPWLEGRN